MHQRDIFINEITKEIEKDKNIFFLSADFGAPALDKLRSKFPKNFIHCGISEQAMLDVASGLSLEGNKVFVYAMAPFLSLRAIEQAKCGAGLMNLPICMISVGVGLGYADAGPTHYSTEDFACFRSLIASTIYTPSDSETTKKIAIELLKKPSFAYVRLDREPLQNLEPLINDVDFDNGFRIFGEPDKKKVVLVSHGKMLQNCHQIYSENKDEYICVDIFKSKKFPKKLPEKIKECKGIVVVDEQGPSANLSSCIFEGFSEQNIYPKIINKSLPEKYIFENGGREFLLNKFGLSKKDIIEEAKKFN